MVAPQIIVEALEQATTPEDRPAWFEVVADEVARTLVLVRHEAMGELFGWLSGPDCDAVGVVGGGWGRTEVSGSGVTGSDVLAGTADATAGARPDPQRVRVIAVVARDGTVAARTTLGDGAVIEDGCRGGRLHDALHRCLGLATDPAPTSSAALIGDLWLAAVAARVAGSRMASAGRDEVRLTWPEVAALHPASQLLSGHGHALSLAELEAVIRVAPQAWTWDQLHADTAAGGGLSGLVAPEVAGWMDTGMFARWTLELHGDPRDLWGRAVAGLEETAVLRLADALDEAEATAEGAARSGGRRHRT